MFTCSLFVICNTIVSRARAGLWMVGLWIYYLPWRFPLSPLLPCSLPSSLNPSYARLLPPLSASRRTCLVSSHPRSFPSSILPPSTLSSSTEALFLHSIIASPMLPPSPPPSLTYLHHSLPSPPSPSSHPPLAYSFPPSILPRSYHAPPCLTVYRRPIQHSPSPCVCWRAAMIRSYCLAPRCYVWHWHNLVIHSCRRCSFNDPLLHSAYVLPPRIRFWRIAKKPTVETCYKHT